MKTPSAASDSPVPRRVPREGWDEAFTAAGSGDEVGLLIDFPNEFDEKEWCW